LHQPFKERFAALTQAFFEPMRAVAVGAGPGLGAVPVAAILAIVGVFDAEEFEVFLPIGTLLLEWSRAKAGFDPMGCAVVGDSGMFEVVEVLIAGDRALAESVV